MATINDCDRTVGDGIEVKECISMNSKAQSCELYIPVFLHHEISICLFTLPTPDASEFGTTALAQV